MCASVGLQGFERQRNWRFILFAARKPGAAPTGGAAGDGGGDEEAWAQQR